MLIPECLSLPNVEFLGFIVIQFIGSRSQLRHPSDAWYRSNLFIAHPHQLIAIVPTAWNIPDQAFDHPI